MRQLIALSRVLDEVDGDSFSTLEGRISLQKRIYLVQALGIDMGYTFAWNQYGPYSPELALDGTDLESDRERIQELGSSLKLRESANQTLAEVRQISQVPDDLGLTPVAWLELLASTHFAVIKKVGGFDSLNETKEAQVGEFLLQTKPYFVQRHVDSALDALRKYIHGSQLISA